MKATDFEYRHQRLVHQFIVAASFLTYLVQRDDVVWRFVMDRTTPRELERILFIIATLFVTVGAALCTWARASDRSATELGPYVYLHHLRYLGDFVYAVGLGSLAPLSGFVILVVGEALLLLRLMRREEDTRNLQQLRSRISPVPSSVPGRDGDPRWAKAFRKEAVKWGLVLRMLVFVITLKDRLAEILACASFLVGLLFNPPFFDRSSYIDEAG
jgi:hypothetical protein